MTLDNPESDETWDELSLRNLLMLCKEQAESLIRKGRSLAETGPEN